MGEIEGEKESESQRVKKNHRETKVKTSTVNTIRKSQQELRPSVGTAKKHNRFNTLPSKRSNE